MNLTPNSSIPSGRAPKQSALRLPRGGPPPDFRRYVAGVARHSDDGMVA
jgi:hypothetical protein